jgi:hypothetical protein, TIGR02147
MGEKNPSKKIFEYLDYRGFLKDYYNAKKEANPAFSLRVFSDKIGFKAKDFISRVMNGDKNLSSQSIPKVASGLRLGKHETEFFVALVKFNQAETTEERNGAFEEMQAVLKVVRFAEKQHLLGHTQYMVYSHWRHLTIRSLIGMYGFDGDYETLARRVHPRITAEEAKKSVKLLEDCQLINKNKNGKYELTESAITTGDRTSKLALRGFHQQCLKLAADSIDRDPPGKRHISGLTLGISQEGYERIVERINAFRKEIALIAEEDKNSDKVFQLQFALFPVGGK